MLPQRSAHTQCRRERYCPSSLKTWHDEDAATTNVTKVCPTSIGDGNGDGPFQQGRA